jgi:epoxyqueuosine reductase
MTLTQQLKQTARELGFAHVGVCAAVPTPGWERFQQWLADGYAGEMKYLEDRRDAYAHPRHVLDGARSLVMLGWNYRTAEPELPTVGQGRVSRYAWGEVDYHDVLRERLHRLADQLREWSPGCLVRGVVDTAPLLEREFAQLAGLGWVGKNTLLIHRQLGSWFFLAALLTDIELDCDPPWTTDHCGTCRACLEACPTQAFPRPYVLDATKCVSYLTIELRQAAPPELREGIQDWLFGCDVCQDVCPWNRRTPRAAPAGFDPRPDRNPVNLIELLGMDEATFRERFRGTPLWRAKRRGLLRNAAYVLGNQRCEEAKPALKLGLTDSDPLVRGACTWALGKVGGLEVVGWLEELLAVESDASVRGELAMALESLLS